jgi:hypothetical protein
MQQHKGRVVSVFELRHYLFVSDFADGHEYFCHQNRFSPGTPFPKKDQIVSFDVSFDFGPRPQAINLKLAGGAR